MITTYLLQNCKHCKELLKYIKKNPNVNICLIMVSKDDIKLIKENEPRIKQFPVAFTGNPKKNGLPYKNSHVISGSSTILDTLKNNFGYSNNVIKKRGNPTGTLTGSNIDIDYLNNNEGNISSLTNIRKHRNNCFGNTCHVMDRPFGPSDNQYILQGYQPPCTLPIRSDLPIRKSNSSEMNYFGMTTPGTKNWQLERQPWPSPRILVDDRNMEQYLNGNKMAAMNTPRTFKDDYLNRKIWNPLNLNNFGTKGTKVSKNNNPNNNPNKFISGPVNQTAPFLTYAAGGNGVSRVTGKNFLREQVPIERSPQTAFISGNIKNYVSKNLDNQRLLAGGLDSPWSINAQGINYYGNKNSNNNLNNNSSKKQIKLINKVPRPSVPSGPSGPKKSNKPFGDENPWTLTRTVSGNGTNQTQYFKRQRFPNNGNGFGKPKKETLKPKKKKEMKFTSPLGIEISFN
jgi:hypothetical protein